MPALHLLPIGLIESRLLHALAAELPRRFAVSVVVDPPTAPPKHWKTRPGARFDAPAVLRDLVAAPPEDGGWRLALLDGELAGPGVRTGCGFAAVGGCCAVIALGALQRLPTAPGQDDTFQRALTVAVHEVGHLAGLEHCADPACVMHFSRGADALTRKAADFCDRCQARATGG